MRIALLSDIHGNSVALNAGLKDIRAQGGIYVIQFMRGQNKPAWSGPRR